MSAGNGVKFDIKDALSKIIAKKVEMRLARMIRVPTAEELQAVITEESNYATAISDVVIAYVKQDIRRVIEETPSCPTPD